jgi:hypothetical protein
MQIRYPLAMAAWTTLSAIAYAQPTGDQNYRLLPAKEPPTAPFYGTLPTTPQQPAISLPVAPGTVMQPPLPPSPAQ